MNILIYLTKLRYVYWYTAISTLLLAISACDKAVDSTSSFDKEKMPEQSYKILYEELNIADQIRDSLRTDLIVNYLPQWDQTRQYQKNDSSHHTIVPLTPMVNEKGIVKVANSVSDFPFLFILNGKHFYFGRFFAPLSIDGLGINMDSLFINGTLELTDVFANRLIQYHYQNGVGEYIEPVKVGQLSVNRNPKSRYELRCYTEITCTWTAECQGAMSLATSPGGTCQQPLSLTPCDYSVRWDRSADIKREVCENVWVPDPIDPGPGGGGGDPVGDDIIIEKQKILRELKLSDCDGIKRANEIAKDARIQNAINAIKAQSKEWGVEIKLVDPNDPTKFTVGDPFTNSDRNQVTVNPYWNSNNGYTIGFIHNHPSGGAPSPSDIFNASIDLMVMVEHQGIPPNQLSLYLNNYTSMIVSGDYVYTVSIRDAQLFAYMSTEFKAQRQKTENIRYKELITQYLDDRNYDGINRQQMQSAGESALLKLFGEMFNLNKQKIGETDKNETLRRDSNGEVSNINPCTP